MAGSAPIGDSSRSAGVSALGHCRRRTDPFTMLQNINDLYGHKLAASDGEIGQVRDFYFDDHSWVVRYLVAETGTWLSGRQVLISPHAFGPLDPERKVLSVKLTRKQIEDSPSIDTHRPVSRQFEVDYYNYYGWPTYWDGGNLWGTGNYPVIVPPPLESKRQHQGHKRRDDVHLRSTVSVRGYEIQASDGPIGTTVGFQVDDQTWAIADMIVKTGHWFAGKEIMISPNRIERISYENSKVHVYLTKADIEQTAAHEVVKSGT